jgi:hypothetical protein
LTDAGDLFRGARAVGVEVVEGILEMVAGAFEVGASATLGRFLEKGITGFDKFSCTTLDVLRRLLYAVGLGSDSSSLTDFRGGCSR